MPKKTRNPSHPPTPASKEPRGSRADKAGAPATSRLSNKKFKKLRKKIAASRSSEGLDREISMLRSRLRKFNYAHEVPNRDTQMSKTLTLLIRALAAKSRMSHGSSAPSEEGLDNMLRGASEKFGLKIIPWESNC